MPQENTKKLSILYILKVLKECSDENHPLTQEQIANKIEHMSGIVCERKSIASNIQNLIDFGFDIQKAVGKKGVYLGEREFEPSEISFLVDALFSCKSINSKQARELAQKLSNQLSVYEQKKYNYIYKTDEVARTNNKQIFYNIETIHKAIEENRQVSFVYNKYDIDGNLVPRSSKPYIINPYFMVNSMGTYYLVCNNSYFNTVSNFRIEEITNIKILKTPIRPTTELDGYNKKGLDVANYINSNIYMFGDNQIEVKIKIDNEYMVSQVRKWFGDRVKIKQENNQIFGYLTSSEMSIIYWALQYCENVEIVEPISTREKMKNFAKTLSDRYNNI